jgi:hypothetical protein
MRNVFSIDDMKHLKLEIGRPLKLEVIWYDQVPVPPQEKRIEGEVIGWRQSQLIVRVPNYAVIRFWKSTGFEVGNPATDRRGYRIDLEALAESLKPDPGVEVPLNIADGQVSVLPANPQ